MWIIVELDGEYLPSVPCARPVENVAVPQTDPISGRYRRAAHLASQGRIDEAIPHFEKALRLRPDFMEARLALGTALLIRGDRRAAKQHYLEALRLRPGDPAPHYRLAAALVLEERTDEAMRHLAEVLRENPAHQGAQRLMRRLEAHAS